MSETPRIEFTLDGEVVAVAGDPLADISVMENVSFVMKEGVVYKP